MVLSARFVKTPQIKKLLICEHCERPISKSHIRLYGMAHYEEKPYTLRFHLSCIQGNVDVSQEPKIESALKLASLER